MTPFERKVFMLKNGLTISEMARELKDENVSESSLRVMISEMIYNRAFYPRHAKTIKEKFGLSLERPKRKPVSEIIKQAA